MNFFRRKPGDEMELSEPAERMSRDLAEALRDPDMLIEPGPAEDMSAIGVSTFSDERPPAPPEPSVEMDRLEPEPETPAAPAGDPFVARARMAEQVGTVSPRRRIWDLEPGSDPAATPVAAAAPEMPMQPVLDRPVASDESLDTPVAPPVDEAEIADDVALARAQIARFAQAGIDPEAAPQASGRAKTRLLGFRPSAYAERNPLEGEAAEETTAAPMFPVGWILVVEGPGRGACFTLTAGVSSIGRSEEQAISLNFGDGSISRENHASIAYDEEVNQFFLGQGGKSNIVRLNNRPVLSTEDLKDGDRIRIGETSLLFVALCGEDFSWGTEDEGEEAADESDQ